MPVRTRGLCLLVLASSLACGPDKADTTATTSTTAGTTGTGDPGHSVTGNDPTTTTTASTTTASTTAVLTTGAGTTGTTDTGFVFIFMPDGGGFRCPDADARTKYCDPWAQDCPAGQKCTPWSAGCDSLSLTRCVEVVPDPVGLGGACHVEVDPLSGEDDCDVGLLCAHVDPDTLAGTCVSFCKGTPDALDCTHDPGTSCLLLGDGLSLGGLCLPTCDPLAQTCPQGQLCHPNPSDPLSFVCLDDSSGDAGAAFDPCQHTDCDPGLACVDPGFASECALDSNCCTPFCDLDAPACPGLGQVCVPYFGPNELSPGNEDVGLCGLL